MHWLSRNWASVNALFLFGAGLSFAADDGAKIKPVMVWTGTDSAQKTESFVICRNEAALQDVWHKHRNSKDKWDDALTCPQVDFDSVMVAAIFNGKSGNEYGIRVVEILETK